MGRDRQTYGLLENYFMPPIRGTKTLVNVEHLTSLLDIARCVPQHRGSVRLRHADQRFPVNLDNLIIHSHPATITQFVF